ncbi:MAG: N-acetylmuramoyl-L-alanine amidase [Coriobacteriia bacterium]|nr:N-acetylmuramoyl-L-alanine amidase [Coriobacteriia bacterium]
MREPEGLTESRTARHARRASRRRKLALYVGVGALCVVALVAGIWFSATRGSGRTAEAPSTAARAIALRPVAVSAQATSVAAATSRIEVPDLSGMAVQQAASVLRAAGLQMKVSTEGTATNKADVVVLREQPTAGTVTAADSIVVITVPVLAPKSVSKSQKLRASGKPVVVIDPGHQSRANGNLEPIGPGSLETKPRMTVGTTGALSGVPEYEIDLEIATNLQDRLKAAGVRVVMTRTTNDVDISNAQRAQIANAAKASLFVRIHADANVDPKYTGVSVLYPASDLWTKSIFASSRRAALTVQQHLVEATGASDDGVAARDDITGFNWSTVPVISVQAGSQSNQVEDRLLSSSSYQDRVAQGIADGILAYLSGGR